MVVVAERLIPRNRLIKPRRLVSFLKFDGVGSELAPELGVITSPSRTSIYHLSSLYCVLLQASPRETPKSNGSFL